MSPDAPLPDDLGGDLGGDTRYRLSTGVGMDLRIARERLGWTTSAIAANLRIRLSYLEAIEDGRLADLPGNAYAVGFFRAYASAVGLDPDEVSRRFRAETSDLNNKTKLNFPAPVPERGVPAGAAVLLGVVLVVAVYAGWYSFSGDRGAQLNAVQPVPERLVPLEGTTGPVIVPAPPVPVLMPASRLLATVPVPDAKPVAVPPSVPAAADGGRMVIRAKSESWVQVREKAGPVVFNRTMRAGETWPVPNKPGLLLTVGNAGGTELLVDGVASAALGGDGVVRRDLPLDLDQVRDGKLAANPQSAAKPPLPKQP